MSNSQTKTSTNYTQSTKQQAKHFQIQNPTKTMQNSCCYQFVLLTRKFITLIVHSSINITRDRSNHIVSVTYVASSQQNSAQLDSRCSHVNKKKNTKFHCLHQSLSHLYSPTCFFKNRLNFSSQLIVLGSRNQEKLFVVLTYELLDIILFLRSRCQAWSLF